MVGLAIDAWVVLVSLFRVDPETYLRPAVVLVG
jgi:hypothetical protein